MGKNKRLNLGLMVGLLIISAFLVGGCAPAGEGETGGISSFTILFLVLIFAVFYFITIRPQRKRQKQHQELVQELQRGDKVITAGGIYGVIENLSEDSIVLKIESGTTLRIARGSILGKRDS